MAARKGGESGSSLDSVLQILGYTTEPAAFAGHKNVLRDKRLVTMGTPEQVWKWLRRTRQIR